MPKQRIERGICQARQPCHALGDQLVTISSDMKRLGRQSVALALQRFSQAI
jgi:hypothetical protein